METAAELHDLLDKILSTEVEFLTAAEASEFAGKIERASRKLDAIAVSIVDVVDRNQLYTEDGHASATAWSAYTCRTTRREAMRRVALAKMFRSLDETARCYRTGSLGREQAGFMARASGNPRCGHLLADSEATLLADERKLYANQFKNLMKHWVYMADAEGRQQRHDTLHEFRDLRITEQFDGGFTIEGCHGPTQGALAKALFEPFVAVERLADWDAARAEHGENANVTHLRRTEAQRRADAFINIFLQAAAKPATKPVSPNLPVRSRCDSTRRTIAPTNAKPWVAPRLHQVKRSALRSPDTSDASSSEPEMRRSRRNRERSPDPYAPSSKHATPPVSGPDARSHPTDAKPITPHPGATPTTPPQATAHPSAAGTTDTKNAATAPGKTPKATGSSNAPTAPLSPPPPEGKCASAACYNSKHRTPQDQEHGDATKRYSWLHQERTLFRWVGS
jgi:Domain of unknown function (DUF222)